MKYFPEYLEDIEYNLHSFDLEFEKYYLNKLFEDDKVDMWPFNEKVSIDKMKNFTKIVVNTSKDVFEKLRTISKYFEKSNKSTLDTTISHIYFEFRRINYLKDRYSRLCDPQILKCLEDLVNVNKTFDSELDNYNKRAEKNSGMLLISPKVAKQKAARNSLTQLLNSYTI